MAPREDKARTARVGDPPEPLDVTRRGDPRNVLSGRQPGDHWEIYPDPSGAWRWRLVAGNGEVVASGEGYADEASVRRGVATVIRTVSEAALAYGEPVVEVVEG